LAIHKIILIGEFRFGFYEAAFSSSLKKAGLEVIEVPITFTSVFSFLYKVELYFTIIGPITNLFYKKLNKIVFNNQPQLILFWRPTQITPFLVNSLKQQYPSALLVSYNNDNPFGKEYQRGSGNLKRLWNNFISSIPAFDINIVYRKSNILDYQSVGSKNTLLFPPAFIPSAIPDFEDIDYKYDVVFIGYSEKKRINYLNCLIAAGVNVKIYGTGWNIQNLHPSYPYAEIYSVHGSGYFRCLREGRINIAFLSDLNEDVYTRRNFEIPGMGGLMLSERTEELLSFFEEGKEAFFFSTQEELLECVHFILANPAIQNQVRKAAKKKSYSAGYDLDSRVNKLLSELIPFCE